MISLDTNVLLYALQPGEKQSCAASVLEKRPLLSVQVLNEYASVTRRKLRQTWDAIAEDLDMIRALASRVVPVSDTANCKAVALASRYQLAFYDSVLLAVALEHQVRTIYSEDMQHDLLIDGTLRIVDPFR